jgi:hypothetical protein
MVMSNFQTFGAVTEGLEGSARALFVASTIDTLAQITAAGYLNDLNKKIKDHDSITINYSDTSTFPLNTGEATLFASGQVQYDPVLNNWNWVPNAYPALGISDYYVYSHTYAYAGGSASFTLSNSNIDPTSFVIARWQSSANPVSIKTVSPGLGMLTVVSTGDPGASVLEYIAIPNSVLLLALGVYSNQYSYAGGSATFVIPDARMTAASIVNANFASQANAAEVLTATAALGALTVVCTANPGVSVINYDVVVPSATLTAKGLYAAQYVNAGGSATTVVADATITAASIVTADWSSQTNPSRIEKVTPTAGTLTILSSADPGASVLSYIATLGSSGAA